MRNWFIWFISFIWFVSFNKRNLPHSHSTCHSL